MKNLKLIIAFGLIILASACKKHNTVEPITPPKDVYVAGYDVNSATKQVAKLWKNGVATTLTDGTKGAIAYGVFVK